MAAQEDAALAAEGMHVIENKLPLGLKPVVAGGTASQAAEKPLR
jgi:hypothetical protein